MKTANEIREILLERRLKFATVSGVWTTKPNLIRKVDDTVPDIDIITTKSFQVRPTSGNREPIVAEVAVGSYVNAVGLRNPGMKVAYKELKKLRTEKPLRSILNVSISGNSPEDFVKLAQKFEDIADMYELNFSCPHAKAGYGASIGVSPELVKEYMDAIRPVTKIALFPKLTPNVENIGEIARVAVAAGADGLVAINTVGPEAYRDPVSDKLVLYNPDGHKGGRSGEHIFDVAVQKIKEIREAVGPDIPIIGMGGVSRGSQVRAIQRAGANVVGVGSAIARINDEKYREYFEALRFDTENHTDSAASYLSVKRLAKYKKYTITKINELSETMWDVELEGDPILFKASQYVFVWIPGVGEKPFGIVSSSPLRFIVRLRETNPKSKIGKFTKAFFKKKVGEPLYVRGPYGKLMPENMMSHVIILSGGTGLALVPKLAESLAFVGRIVNVFHGVTDKKEGCYQELIEPYATMKVVEDAGKPGRILDAMEERLEEIETNNCTVYTIGPDMLMKKALELAVKKGCSPEYCYASLETNNMCGIGMCGECECGGILSCKNGTFYDYPFLQKNYFKEELENN
ncbi:MAG: dihydroorotate dehydrogenase [Candidatus Marinimicrobia bacterium]|nr:dihydroorotate dehydrogenase [Candidatus Neomarinimicrobiota bacterium]